MTDYEFIESQRGGKILILNNFLFNLKEKKENFSTWKCRVKNCNSKVKVLNDGQYEVDDRHEHPPSIEEEIDF